MQELLHEKRHIPSRYENLSDQHIVRLAQTGDDRASEYLLYKYRSLVRTKIRPYFIMGAEKEDLLQVGVIGLWQAIMDYRSDREISFLSFARICVERHVITAIKTASRQKQAPLNSSIPLDLSFENSDENWNLADVIVTDDVLDPEELVLKREDNVKLYALLRGVLSSFEWRVLSGYQAGKSYREIAQELKCKTKSVDNALVRIKRKMSSLSNEIF